MKKSSQSRLSPFSIFSESKSSSFPKRFLKRIEKFWRSSFCQVRLFVNSLFWFSFSRFCDFWGVNVAFTLDRFIWAHLTGLNGAQLRVIATSPLHIFCQIGAHWHKANRKIHSGPFPRSLLSYMGKVKRSFIDQRNISISQFKKNQIKIKKQ